MGEGVTKQPEIATAIALSVVEECIRLGNLPIMWEYQFTLRGSHIHVKVYVGDKILDRQMPVYSMPGDIAARIDELLEEARVYRNIYNAAYRASPRLTYSISRPSVPS